MVSKKLQSELAALAALTAHSYQSKALGGRCASSARPPTAVPWCRWPSACEHWHVSPLPTPAATPASWLAQPSHCLTVTMPGERPPTYTAATVHPLANQYYLSPQICPSLVEWLQLRNPTHIGRRAPSNTHRPHLAVSFVPSRLWTVLAQRYAGATQRCPGKQPRYQHSLPSGNGRAKVRISQKSFYLPTYLPTYVPTYLPVSHRVLGALRC